MKYIGILFAVALISFVSCNQHTDNTQALQAQIDSLQTRLQQSYKPGLGEFMSGIQVHHNKLWFAGINNNWKLADFELSEIKETLEDIQKYNTDRKEVPSISMLSGPIDEVNKAIQGKDEAQFKAGFMLLTNTCNTCHHANHFEFNVIKIPDAPPFTNQNFKPEK